MIASQMRAHQERYRDLRRDAEARHAVRFETNEATQHPLHRVHRLLRRAGGRPWRGHRVPSRR